ncbi:MAG: DUF6549 family protein [Bacteroidia bacterium]
MIDTNELKNRVYQSEGWIMKNRAMIIFIVVCLYALFATKSCMQNKEKATQLSTAIQSKNDTITYWKDKTDIEHAKASSVVASLDNMKAIYQSKIDSITKKLNIKEKQITDFVGVSTETKGKFKSKVDTIFLEREPEYFDSSYYDGIDIAGPNDLPAIDTVTPKIDYLESKYIDKWLTFHAKIKNGTLTGDYNLKDSITILGYWKKSGFLNLGRKNYFIDVSSSNPNTHIENVSNFHITSEPKRKIGLGFIGGYGVGLKTIKLEPFLGIGLFYKLL